MKMKIVLDVAHKHSTSTVHKGNLLNVQKSPLCVCVCVCVCVIIKVISHQQLVLQGHACLNVAVVGPFSEKEI